MLKNILENLGIKHFNPLLVESWDMILLGYLFIGIGLYVNQSGWILVGSCYVLIYFSASVYTYKTKRKHPIFDILCNVTLLVAMISLAVNFLNANLFIAVLSICAAILLSYALYKQIKKASLKQ